MAAMLFNTPEFIFVFLPAALILHYWLARRSPDAAMVGTTISSLVFYGWWNPPFVLLPIVSICTNYLLAKKMVAADKETNWRLLIAGIVANLLVLCYFKYADFLISILDGHTPRPPNVPLALSFTTFVQIAFLVDVYRRRIPLQFRSYALFVAFFPHLIAGPIVRWSSLGRQLGEPERYRVNWDNVALGLTIFIFGLVKKVVLADSLAPHVAGVFDAATRGEPVTALAAWAGSTAFVAQIYFDFSGYSDMAIGLGLLFNYRLPINFAAPLRSTSLFDLWRRWHITLSRFMRDFLYIPLGFNHPGPLRKSMNLMITMMLGGLWHGANWTFIAWGAFHGVLLLINVAWREFRGPGRPGPAGRLIGWVLTFGSFVVGAVFFRSVDIHGAWHIFTAMAGFGDAAVAERHFQMDDWMIRHGYISDEFVRIWLGATWSMVGTLWTAVALVIILAVPDTMEITGYREGDAQSDWRRPVGLLAWRPSPVSVGIAMIMFVVVFLNVGRVSEFLYYQF
jgi:D-alanyl-lipoteichoic acid acyltransferase DltB (MBOAT superfamily)